MTRKQQRRRFLAGLGVAGVSGLAGCLGQVQDLRSTDSPDESPTETDEPTADESEPEEPEQELHSGETIPTHPYYETASEPLNPDADPDADNPVLTADDIDDFDASYLADPSMFVEDDSWHMFFDATVEGRGRIAHATSDDGVNWEYDGVVLNLRHHVSYPGVFKWQGEYYMTVQENPSTRPVSLYKANSFPYDWYRTQTLFDPAEYGHGLTDRSLFHWNDRWWCLGGYDRGDTYVYYSDELETGGWQPHDDNPVVEDRPRGSRPAGRPIVRDDDILVFFQSLVGGFGQEVNAYRITDLEPDRYQDERHPASPLVQGSDRLDAEDEPVWNADRMHQYDAWYMGEGEGWRIAVDGDDGNNDWSIGIYHVRE